MCERSQALLNDDEQVLIRYHGKLVNHLREAGMNITSNYLNEHFPQWRKVFPDIEVLMNHLVEFPVPTQPYSRLQDASLAVKLDDKSISRDISEDPTSKVAYTNELLTCKYCYGGRATSVTLPCGHFSVCDSCSVNLRKCKICHIRVKGILKAFLS